jgi:hypothetical protein
VTSIALVETAGLTADHFEVARLERRHGPANPGLRDAPDHHERDTRSVASIAADVRCIFIRLSSCEPKRVQGAVHEPRTALGVRGHREDDYACAPAHLPSRRSAQELHDPATQVKFSGTVMPAAMPLPCG